MFKKGEMLMQGSVKGLLGLAGLLFTFGSVSYACPELQGVDFSSDESIDRYEILHTAPAVLTRDELRDIPYLYEGYEYCRDLLDFNVLRATATGRIFFSIVSTEDACDGGNVIGALLYQRRVVATIGDGYVACNDVAPVSYDSLFAVAQDFAASCVDPSAAGTGKVTDVSAFSSTSADDLIRSAKVTLARTLSGDISELRSIRDELSGLAGSTLEEREECDGLAASLSDAFEVFGAYASNTADEGGWVYFLKGNIEGSDRLIRIEAFHHN